MVGSRHVRNWRGTDRVPALNSVSRRRGVLLSRRFWFATGSCTGKVTSILDSLGTPQLMLLMESVEMAGTIGAQVSVCRCEVCMYTLASTWKKKEQLKRTVYVLLLLMERRVLELSSHVCVCVTRNHGPEDFQHSPVAPHSVGTALSIDCTVSDDRSSLLMHRSCALPYEVRSHCHRCSSLRQSAISNFRYRGPDPVAGPQRLEL